MIEVKKSYRDRDFERHIKKYNFRVVPVKGRKDIRSVTYRGAHMFTVPAGILDGDTGTDMNGLPHPNYKALCDKAFYWHKRVKNTNWLKQYYEK